MIGADDFIFRGQLSTPGFCVYVCGCQPIDFIHVEDLCRAMVLAAQALNNPSSKVAGEAFFLTKGFSLSNKDLAQRIAGYIGWWVVPLPKWGQFVATSAMELIRILKPFVGLEVPGVREQWMLVMPLYQQTFDNTKAQKMLGYKPKLTVEDAFSRIGDEWLRKQGRFMATVYPAIPVVGLLFILCSVLYMAARVMRNPLW